MLRQVNGVPPPNSPGTMLSRYPDRKNPQAAQLSKKHIGSTQTPLAPYLYREMIGSLIKNYARALTLRKLCANTKLM